MDNFVNTAKDESFIKFSTTSGKEFNLANGITMWSTAFNNIYSMIIKTAPMDLTLDMLNTLIDSEAGPWTASYFNHVGAGGEFRLTTASSIGLKDLVEVH